MISRIGNHIYAKCADEAITLYKKAFDLAEKGAPWLDDDGSVIHKDLWSKDDKNFLSVSDYNGAKGNAKVRIAMNLNSGEAVKRL